ncbi:MAG: ScpA family protein [Chloroflexota bacterium]|nr:segregation/condensation protein A [Dehalococcoidia bacterium]MDW8252350.1 ScpA family protein [Chloroflexota bacterium]
MPLDLASRPRFAVHLEVFDGPLDLLLALIERHELDISVVSLLAVTDQFLAYLEANAADLDEIAAYLVVAAKLLLLKSIRLLPPPAVPPREEENEPDAIAAAEALARQLRDYQRLKAAAAALRQREEAGLRCWPRRVPPALAPARRLAISLPPERLRQLLLSLAHRRRPSAADALPPPAITVAEQIETLRRLLARHETLSFRSAVGAHQGVAAIVATFLAMLEMVRRGEAEVEQLQPFGDILLRRPRAPRSPQSEAGNDEAPGRPAAGSA